jgi:hypothetical protein
METAKKPAHRLLTFKDATNRPSTRRGMAASSRGNKDALEQALLLLRDLHVAEHGIAEDVVLKQVENALNNAAKAKIPL